jgi:malate dehydrogenase (oxaloacetate-decarboxylating)(NADP+)
VALAGVLAAKRVTGRSTLKDETFLFLGAGEAALGIAELIAFAITQENEGLSMEEARRNIWLFDSKGLIVEGRGHLTEHKSPFAHPGQVAQTSFVEAVRAIRPMGIIGVSTIAKSFNKEVLELMAEINEQPLVFALSNPTSKSECTFEEAVQHTKGKVIFASGSPFPALTWEGKTRTPGQSNNCYIFPGLGLSIALTQMRRVAMEHFYLAANTVAEMTSEEQLASGCLFPPLGEVRDVSAAIAAAVAEREKEEGRLMVPDQADWLAYAKAAMYDPLK